MTSCFDVFNTWDDEYEKLQSLLRDIAKKKREETLKMVWRINPSHKKLQDRLNQMRVYVFNFLFVVFFKHCYISVSIYYWLLIF